MIITMNRFFRIYGHSKWEEDYFAYWRGWLSIGANGGIDIDLNLFDKKIDLSLDVGRGGRSIKFHFSIPFIVSFWIKSKGVLPYGEGRTLGFRVHNGTVWVNLWTEPWNGKYHSFHVSQWIFGKSVYSEVTLEQRDILVPMPEKAYAGSARLFESSWTFPRWFTQRMKRVEIKVPEGLPHEGKGENSYDCGLDATFGMTTGPCSSIAEGVGNLVGSVLHSRVKYGGYGDWDFKKVWPEKTSI